MPSSPTRRCATLLLSPLSLVIASSAVAHRLAHKALSYAVAKVREQLK